MGCMTRALTEKPPPHISRITSRANTPIGIRKILHTRKGMSDIKTWSNQEVSILLENYNKISNTKLQVLLPGKSVQGIYKKAYKMGLRKSPEIEFINRSEAKRGEKSGNWRGGIRKTSKGYRQTLLPEHPRADSSGYVMEHILVWERETGLLVPPGFCIHHLNGDKSDNRIENLCLMPHAAHTKHHSIGRKHSEETKAKISEARRDKIC